MRGSRNQTQRSLKRTSRTHHVVDLQDAADRLGGQGERADGDQQGLHHQLLHDVGDPSLWGGGDSVTADGPSHTRPRGRGGGGLTLRTLMPAILSPWACLLRSSVTVEMGFRPAFSASVEGMTSRASP